MDNQFWQQAEFVKSSFFLVFIVPRKSLGTHFTLAVPPVFFASEGRTLDLGSQPAPGNQLIFLLPSSDGHRTGIRYIRYIRCRTSFFLTSVTSVTESVAELPSSITYKNCAVTSEFTKVFAHKIPDAATAGTPIPGMVLSPTRYKPLTGVCGPGNVPFPAAIAGP